MVHAARGDRHGRAAHLAAADTALDHLERTRPIEAGMVRAQRLVTSGAHDEALSLLAAVVAGAPPGFAGWTIPIEPILSPLRQLPAFRALEQALVLRAE
jgi:hypothetical protein